MITVINRIFISSVAVRDPGYSPVMTIETAFCLPGTWKKRCLEEQDSDKWRKADIGLKTPWADLRTVCAHLVRFSF